MHSIHLDSPICLDAPVCLDVPHTFGCPHISGSIQTYGGQPNIWKESKHTGGCPNIGSTQTCRVHPNIWGCSNICGHPNIQGVSKHTGGAFKHTMDIQMYGAYGHPLSLTKHAFFVLFMYRGHPNVWGHMNTSLV